MKVVLFLLAWQVNAADVAGESEKLLETKIEQNETMGGSELIDIRENSSEAEEWNVNGGRGPSRRRFVLKYYPNQNTGIQLWNQFWRGGRRRHLAMRPVGFRRDKYAPVQDLWWCNRGRNICNDYNGQCLDSGGHQNDLYWHPCHNGGNQNFWLEQWGGDGSRGAHHIHIGGNKGNRRRRRHQCVDMGGGRLYIHNCHNGDNQRFVWKWATTTSTTSTTTTTTTTKVKVYVQTFMLPEKMEWKIIKGKTTVCSSGEYAYSTWYSRFFTGCTLPAGSYTLKCIDKRGYGWSGGYIDIGGKKYCKDGFEWSGKVKALSITLKNKRR